MVVDLYFEILPKRQRELFDKLAKAKWVQGFYLAGGTALALQIGHRRSIDFDFFRPDEFDVFNLKTKIIELGSFELFSESADTIHGAINNVQISFFKIPYALISRSIDFDNIRIASKMDIAAMKLAALASRGSRKDFIDLYFLLQDYPLEKMLDFYRRKYGESEENIYCTLKGLVYFADADDQDMPGMIINATWGNIKKYIIKAHEDYLTKLRRGKP